MGSVREGVFLYVRQMPLSRTSRVQLQCAIQRSCHNTSGSAAVCSKTRLMLMQIRRGCERNVITYSSLISACEKAGRWELALDLFGEMHREGCKPNVVTYNSLIAACAQGILSSVYYAAKRVQAMCCCHLYLLQTSNVLILVANNIIYT